ncbi:MAG: hypothetical protein ABI960_01365 [Candidatus Eisenbacteria bacterium]
MTPAPRAPRRLNRHSLPTLYRRYFREPRRERLFLASLAFFVTFGAARWVTHAIHGGSHRFGDVQFHGQHVHHLVWGILLLLAVGYGWLIQLGNAESRASRAASRVMAALFGAGAALTLDEFALWLNLRDVYWEREGRVSIDAIALFGALFLAGLWGGPFLRAVAREGLRGARFAYRTVRRAWRRSRTRRTP